MNETMTSISIEASSGASAPLEKIALETYVPPAKPSLVGLSRAEIAERLRAIGVGPGSAQDARAAAVALDLRPRREEFHRDDQHFQGNADATRCAFHRRAPRGGGGAGIQRRHPQMAITIAEWRRKREGA